MTRPFPENPFLQGNFAPLPLEGEIRDVVVEGEIPRDLAGTLYRNGPNPQFPPRGSYHWFDGDGMIHAFRIEDGRVSYRNRWVRTERFLQEREAGESLFGGLADPTATDPRVATVSPNAANTNVVSHGGRLLALWEAGPPTELDPDTLDTIGVWEFDRKLVGPMTAHPKVDPETGEMLMFGYSPIPPHLTYHVVDRGGRLVRSEPIDVPFASMMHDFITTRDHVIFPCFPAIFNLEGLAAGEGAIKWEPDRGVHIGVMPRDGGNDDVVWVQTDPCFVFHPMNAYSEGRRVIADVCRFPAPPLFDAEEEGPPILHRWTIDLDGGTLKSAPLDDAMAEFPRLDERRTGLPYRHGYTGGSTSAPDEEAGPGFNALFHYDLETGRRRAHRLRAGSATSEPVFVPRSANAPEGAGWVLAVVYRDDEKRSDLLILDAEDVEGDPVAIAKLPHRVPFGFHGSWRPAGSTGR